VSDVIQLLGIVAVLVGIYFVAGLGVTLIFTGVALWLIGREIDIRREVTDEPIRSS
jgi:hypothetical protein